MHKIFKKEQILTIPNLLSVFRLLLIPVILWLYCIKKEDWLTVCVIILSGLTDIADGMIARKWNLVSDFGKILDPVADKLTQVSVIACLAFQYKLMWVLIGLFVMKEICMGLLGLVVIKKTDSVNSAKWYGKVNTVVLYLVMMILILFREIPLTAANILILICGCMLLLSFVLYVRMYKELLSKTK